MLREVLIGRWKNDLSLMILSYVAELDNLENFVCIVNDMADDVVVVDEQEHEKPKDKGEELVD